MEIVWQLYRHACHGCQHNRIGEGDVMDYQIFKLVDLKDGRLAEYLALQLPHLWPDGICPAAIGIKPVDIENILKNAKADGESKGYDEGYEEGYRHAMEEIDG